LLHGAPFVTPGQYTASAKQQDVAPTVGAIIGASPLPTYTGRVLTEAVAGATTPPRVVTVIVLDAMRADYFDTYAAVMPTLTRLRKEGAWFSQAHTIVLPTITGVGHANIGTGSEPRYHGIVANNLFNRGTGKAQAAYDDLDTRELMALTLADQWNLMTDGKAVIIGQGGAIRATAEDWEAAALMGIPVGKTYLLAFALGTALAGIAGGLVSVSYAISPSIGLEWTLKALVVIVLAGLGSLFGSFAGGIILGLAEAMSVVFLGGPYREVVGLILFLIVLVVRLQGLFGARS